MAGRGSRNRRDGNDCCGGQFWPAGLDDPCALIRRRGYDGGQWVRRANVDDPQHRSRLGVDPALCDGSVGVPLLCIPPPVLIAQIASGACPFRQRALSMAEREWRRTSTQVRENTSPYGRQREVRLLPSKSQLRKNRRLDLRCPAAAGV